MAKKHWIYLKRGLSEDPKHRARMGECIWLFMHIIDRADWETGIAYDWKDSDEAAAMGMNIETLRHQRQKLARMDYIRCAQKQHGQDITILEWINPRDYSAGVMNRRECPQMEVVEGSNGLPPSEGSNGLPPSEFQGSNQDGNQDGNQGPRKLTTPTYSSEPDSPSVGGSGLTEKEIEQANRKVDAIIAAGRNRKNYTNRDKIPEP